MSHIIIYVPSCMDRSYLLFRCNLSRVECNSSIEKLENIAENQSSHPTDNHEKTGTSEGLWDSLGRCLGKRSHQQISAFFGVFSW